MKNIKQKIHAKRLDKFGFKNGIKIHIEFQWWAVALIVALVLIFKYYF